MGDLMYAWTTTAVGRFFTRHARPDDPDNPGPRATTSEHKHYPAPFVERRNRKRADRPAR